MPNENQIAVFLDSDNIEINMRGGPLERLSIDVGWERFKDWLFSYGNIAFVFAFAPEDKIRIYSCRQGPHEIQDFDRAEYTEGWFPYRPNKMKVILKVDTMRAIEDGTFLMKLFFKKFPVVNGRNR